MSARPAGGQGGGIGARERYRIAVVDGIAHYVTGAQVAILREGRILVQLRLWPPGWELPGGHSDRGESPAETALREGREETGFEVRLIGIVGVYRWQGLRRTADAVYLAEVVGGEQRRSLESMSQRFVGRSRYPRAVFPWIPQRLEDAFEVAAGGPPVLRVQAVTLVHVLFFGSALAGALLDEVRRLRRRRR